MSCKRAEQPLSRSGLEDTGAPALMEIMMTESPEDICLLAYSPQSPGTCGGPGATRVGRGSPTRGDTWHLRSCPEPGAGTRATGTHDGPRSYPELGAGARAAGTCDGPGAAPSWEQEPEPEGHVAASELPLAGRRELLS
jgi:hypothetical protein